MPDPIPLVLELQLQHLEPGQPYRVWTDRYDDSGGVVTVGIIDWGGSTTATAPFEWYRHPTSAGGSRCRGNATSLDAAITALWADLERWRPGAFRIELVDEDLAETDRIRIPIRLSALSGVRISGVPGPVRGWHARFTALDPTVTYNASIYLPPDDAGSFGWTLGRETGRIERAAAPAAGDADTEDEAVEALQSAIGTRWPGRFRVELDRPEPETAMNGQRGCLLCGGPDPDPCAFRYECQARRAARLGLPIYSRPPAIPAAARGFVTRYEKGTLAMGADLQVPGSGPRSWTSPDLLVFATEVIRIRLLELDVTLGAGCEVAVYVARRDDPDPWNARTTILYREVHPGGLPGGLEKANEWLRGRSIPIWLVAPTEARIQTATVPAARVEEAMRNQGILNPETGQRVTWDDTSTDRLEAFAAQTRARDVAKPATSTARPDATHLVADIPVSVPSQLQHYLQELQAYRDMLAPLRVILALCTDPSELTRMEAVRREVTRLEALIVETVDRASRVAGELVTVLAAPTVPVLPAQSRTAECWNCDGQGSNGRGDEDCELCEGTGRIADDLLTCNYCHGTGSTQAEGLDAKFRCSACGGTGRAAAIVVPPPPPPPPRTCERCERCERCDGTGIEDSSVDTGPVECARCDGTGRDDT